MKYVIEIPSKADFVTAYYMEDGLPVMYKSDKIDDLEPYTEPDRKDIEDEVWEFARRIICPSDCCEDSISAHTKEIFNKEGWEIRGIFNDLSYQEAKAKYEAWLKQKDEIRVGDEVNPINDTWRGVVVNVDNGDLTIMGSRGISANGYESKYFSKTGRHFDEVAELLKKMRGEEQ